MFDLYHAGISAGLCSLQSAEERIAGVMRIIDNDAGRIERILKRRANRVHGSGAAFAHAFGAVERER